MSQAELNALRTKKVWEKVIGAVFNKNDEINHLAEHAALINMGMAQLSGTTPSGKKKGSH